MKKILTLLCLMAVAKLASAQEYKTAIGLRGGSPSGLTVKHFLHDNKALEGLLAFHYRGLEIAGLYEVYAPAFGVGGLYWYYGGGGHIGSYKGSSNKRLDRMDTFIAVGADGIVGLEYVIPEIPINFSIDLKPTLNVVGFVGFRFEGGISARYYF